jgi:hypothetical protein
MYRLSSSSAFEPAGAVPPAPRPWLIDADWSLLAFHRRVLDEARSLRHPLLERVKFLAIAADSLGDFLQRRPAGTEVARAARGLFAEAQDYLGMVIGPQLRAEGVAIAADVPIEALWPVAALERADLHDAPFVPRRVQPLADPDPFATLRQRDLLVHRPYESFDAVVSLIGRAAADPDVERIALTLYRTDADSAVGRALLTACHRGAAVDVVIEPHARGDEANNARWAARLARAGARVQLGAGGLKVHAKAALIVRREQGARVRYAHLSSGNYQASTSRVYTDLSLLTADRGITEDVASLFDLLLDGRTDRPMQSVLVAPLSLRDALTQLLAREAAWARSGAPARAILKMNALTDPAAIAALEEAADAGVRVDLIVRGPCCLRPGVTGASSRIRVRSLVGRFLEHSRAWYFRNGGNEQVYIGSADLMPRNFERRVETMTPLRDPAVAARVRDEVLRAALADTANAYALRADGSYARVRPRLGGGFDSHRWLLAVALIVAWLSAPGAAAAQEANGLTLHTGDAFQLALRARLGAEIRSSGSDADEEDTPLDVAHRRVSIDGRIANRLAFQVEQELGSPRPWRDVYIDYRAHALLRVRAGRFKLPYSLEATTGAGDLNFVYRARAVAQLAPGRDAGVMAHARVWRKRLEYEAGVFAHDGGRASLDHPDRIYGGTTIAGRLALTPFGAAKRSVRDLYVAASRTDGVLPEGESDVRGHTTFDRTIYRPRIWVAGRRRRTGLEARWRPGPLVVTGEYLSVADDRDHQGIEGETLPPLIASGWYASGVWRAPRRLMPWRQTHLDAAIRVESLRFGSATRSGAASTDPRATRIADSDLRAVTLGLNLWLARHIKVQFDATRESLHVPADAPLPAGRQWLRMLAVQFAM